MSKTIEISFDPEEIDDYLGFHGSVRIVNSEYAKHVFLCAISDFLKKRISVEVLSGVANRIYYADNYSFYLHFDSGLGQLLDDISEMEYHLAIKDTDTTDKFLLEVKKYFEENKHLLDNDYYHKHDIYKKTESE